MIVGDPRPASPDAISFRPLRYFDLLLLHRWLNAPHGARWWYGDDTSWRGVVEEYLYRGLGGEILRRFLVEVVFRDERVRVCVIGPESKNVAAIRAYEKAGFRFFKTIQVPGEPEPEHLMRIGREEVFGT